MPSPPSSPAPQPSPSKALIVRVRNFIGDVVLAIPALERLQNAGYQLHIVGKPWLRSLFDAYPWPVEKYPASFSERRTLLRSMAKKIEASDPTFQSRINAITFATSFSSVLDMRAAGLRPYGFGAEGRSIMLAGRAKIVYGEHALDSYWRLTSAFLSDNTPPPGATTYRVSDAANREARDAIEAAGIRAGYIVLVPFAGGTFEKIDKKWAGFGELSARLAALDRDMVLAPGPDEEQEARERFPQAKVLSRIGLGAYAAIMRDAALTIANDTGPGHMAASVSGKLLSVLGPTKIEQWGARGPNVRIVKQYPQWPSVDDIMSATRSML
jgi:heptosyltransferase II